MISVIVPAHDEEAVLPRCLAALTEGADPSELEVIVVCNGCSDGSARVARECPFPVRVIETEVASKTHAWNLGDEAASSFPRFYVDADVRIDADAVREVAKLLAAPGVLAAAPRIRVDTSRSSAAVASFYRVWLRLPYFHTGMIGSGVFALSKAGRARFGRFPDIIADDEFVRRHFEAQERATAARCGFEIFAPRDLASLVRIKMRSRLGRVQLDRAGLTARGGSQPSSVRAAFGLAASPSLWAPLFVYAAVVCCARLMAWRRARGGDFQGWARDESSRAPAEVGR